MRAVVVFTDESSEHPFAWVLKKGFKHCFVAVDNGEHWIEIDASTGIPTFRAMAESNYELAAYYREHKMTVVETAQEEVQTLFEYSFKRPYIFTNCVGVVQFVLGMGQVSITPYALYKNLMRKSK